MYTSLRNPPSAVSAPTRARGGRIGRNVVLLGLVSLFTDLSQEMVAAILPLYLTFELGLSALAFGLIDGLYGGATALVRLLGGLVADRRARYKEVAAVGYGVSAACKLGLLAASGAWAPTTVFLMLDRLGKGVRTAPRDSLISLSSDRAVLGRAFGLHRALDTVGALLGPLAAFVLLAANPLDYDAIFLTSFCVALIGLGILLLFVQNRRPSPDADANQPRVSLRSALGLLRGRRFRTIVVVGGLLGLLRSATPSSICRSAGFRFRRPLVPAPVPRDRAGVSPARHPARTARGPLRTRPGVRWRAPSLLAVYLVLLLAQLGTPEVLLCLALLGTYYAATDGVLMALSSSALPETLRTSGLALVTTATATARFFSSLLYGTLWTVWGPQAAVLAFLIALAIAIPPAGLALGIRREVPHEVAQDPRDRLLGTLRGLRRRPGRVPRTRSAGRDAEARNAPVVAQRGSEAAAQLAPQPHLIFRSMAPGNTYGRVGLVPLDDPASPRAMTALNCERVDFAGGHGICLQADRGAITTYDAVLFDERFRELATFPLAGAPSRARVSPDGRVAAYTVFVTGHSYAAGRFLDADHDRRHGNR